MSFKAVKVSFSDEAQFRGLTSPEYHNKKYDLTERRVSARTYTAPGRHEKEPSFLKSTIASKGIAPTTYNNMDAYKKTQMKQPMFYRSNASGNTFAD